MGCPPLGNEYFDNAVEGETKAAEWVGYIFPTPLIQGISPLVFIIKELPELRVLEALLHFRIFLEHLFFINRY